MRPRIIDAFPYNNEADILECRLTELYDAVDAFVLVEADVDHQDHPKPYHYLENAERFAPWADKIVPVQAKGLPTLTENPDPWAREHAQREFIGVGLGVLDATAEDIVLQSDVDEIPTALAARNVRPSGMVAFEHGITVRHRQLRLGLGEGAASYLASDLTYDYVRINAEYTT